ncbi:MAG TPA: FtsX-like permease family protein [Stellaceae bacterium]|nr:FtsX-like permease family protein [Stellaceae bacterium]
MGALSALVAWRMLAHEPGRSLLAAAGVGIAVLMVFLELGFYASVPRAGMLVYDHLRFDILLTAADYVSQEEAYDFPRARLYQALSVDGVLSASPVYEGQGSWLDPRSGVRRDIFVIGVRPGDDAFRAPGIDAGLLRKPDFVLVDDQTLPVYGARAGARVELDQRAVTVGGLYRLGTGFLGLGAVVTSDVNFRRIFPESSLAEVTLGLVRLKPGADPDAVAAELRRFLPADVRVFTRASIARHEVGYWANRTATGLVFGLGVVVSVIVGVLILNQTLSAQILRQLPQYATMKAMGWTHTDLARSVAASSLLLALSAFIPAVILALLIYGEVRALARLPIVMTGDRFALVLAATLVMAAISAVLALRAVRRADPAELF